jgi:CheY-like chemotaxis protein
VDDNADAADSLALLLRLTGHTTHVARDGPAALEAARSFTPDVVLLDIGLPGLNGYEVAKRLRGDPVTADALVIAVSGYGQDSDRQRSREAGFDQHLTKPVDYDELRGLISARRGAHV